MHIAFVTLMSGSPWGGSEELWSQTALRLSKRECVVSAYVYDWSLSLPQVEKLRQHGVAIVGRANRQRKTWRNPFSGLRKVDLVVVSQGFSFDMAYQADGRALADMLLTAKIPFCVLIHSFPEFMWAGDEQREKLRDILAAAVFSGFFSQRSIAACERMIAAKVANSARIWSCCRASVESEAPWPAETPARLLLLGRIDLPCKAQDVVLHALASDEWRERDWALDIVGEGSDTRHLERLISFYGLASRVAVRSFTQQPENLWASYHALIVASRHETGPLTAIEAVLHGRLLISTNVGAIPELIRHGRTGFVVAEAEPHAFRVGLEEAWRRRAEWRQIGTAAQAEFRRIFPKDPVQTFWDALLVQVAHTGVLHGNGSLPSAL